MSKNAVAYGQGLALGMDAKQYAPPRSKGRPPRWSAYESDRLPGQWFAGVDNWESAEGPFPSKAQATEALKQVLRREGYDI